MSSDAAALDRLSLGSTRRIIDCLTRAVEGFTNWDATMTCGEGGGVVKLNPWQILANLRARRLKLTEFVKLHQAFQHKNPEFGKLKLLVFRFASEKFINRVEDRNVEKFSLRKMSILISFYKNKNQITLCLNSDK